MTSFALIGADGLFLLFIWLASAIVGSWVADRKGYGERTGLATGLLLSVVGALVWIFWPAKPDSRWKLQGMVPRRGAPTVAEARARGVGELNE